MIEIKKEAVLIKPGDINPSSPYLKMLGALNPGAIRMPNGDILLYVRIIEKLIKDEDKKYYYAPRFNGEEKFRIKIDRFDKEEVINKTDLALEFKDKTKRLTYLSSLRRVYLDKTGFKVKAIEKKPSFFGLRWDGELGIEDARITKFNDMYIMTYVTLSRKENISTSYAISNDCINWYRRGIIFKEQNKDVVIFPEMIDQKYYAFERPEGSFEFTMPHIWVSSSKDLEFWGDSKPLVLAKRKAWDSGRIGPGPPPIKTKDGWLLIYHGVLEDFKLTQKDKIIRQIYNLFGADINVGETKISYLVGAALFDLKNPAKLIAKTKEPIIAPRKKYEMGTFESKRVVFPTGLVLDKDGKNLLIFCGGGDRVTTVKQVALDDILKELKKV